MLKYIYIFAAFILAATPMSLSADELGDRAIEGLSQRLKEMVNYESDIVVDIQNNVINGHYRVSGDNYHIDMGNVELWGQGDRRYEVSHKIEEIIIERVVENDNMLLNNPSKAFDFVGQGFDATLEQDGAVIRLTPKVVGATNMDVDRILIYLDPQTRLPQKILYEADKDRAVIEFKGIKKSKQPLSNFNPSKYKKYEIVDLY